MTLKSLFSFQGRFSRSQFWLWGVGVQSLAILLWIAVFIRFEEPFRSVALMIATAIVIVLIVAGYASTAKRLHDMGHSGWWSLLVYLGLLMLWVGTTKSIKGWMLIGTKGQYKGCEFPFDDDITFGTNPKLCSVVFDSLQYGCCMYKLCYLKDRQPRLSVFVSLDGSEGDFDWQELDNAIHDGRIDLEYGQLFQLKPLT